MIENYLLIKEQLVTLAKGRGVTLVAVTKNRSIEEIKALYAGGCRDFGENRVQEALEKIELLPKDIRWHLIGPVQSNKVNKIIGKFFLIHSIDSVAIAEKISEKSLESKVKTEVLLQVNVSGESTKHGFNIEECLEKFPQLAALKGVRITGLMTMAPDEAEEAHLRSYFQKLKDLKDQLKLEHLSMGMSGDFKVAVEEGATIVRIGSALFSN